MNHLTARSRRPLPGFAVPALVLAVIFLPSCGSTPTSKPSEPQLAKNNRDVATWLRTEVIPFATTDPTAGLDDLEPLRTLVGNARVVSLGEATHGTREFFQMKHRVLRFLIERMGFNAFAIEATWPEANRLDDYVRTGRGDPVTLLSGLYFWTWNTQEVLDMIRWMRSYNAAGGNLGFYGFDMQSPGMAIDNVDRFVAAVDPASSPKFTAHLSCLARFANGPDGISPSPGYDKQPSDYRNACRQDLQWAQDALNERRVQYTAASSPDRWARAEHSARVAIQYEELFSNRRSRDLAMAENVRWLLDQLPAGSRMMVWAHNGHVATDAVYGGDGSMGYYLRQAFGVSMVVMGFDFARGSFNAVGVSSTGQYTALTSHTVGEPLAQSYEDHFLAAAMPLFILDVRNRTNWVAGPLKQRSIGSVYNDATPDSYFNDKRDPQLYDAMIFIENTTASVLLPRLPPAEFLVEDAAADGSFTSGRPVGKGSAAPRPLSVGRDGSSAPNVK